MKLIIGHASIGSNSKNTGDEPGDNNGREVRTQAYYMNSKGWYLLRPISIKHANAIAEAMLRACDNDNIGYDQSGRLGVIKYGTNSKVKTECDCSSLVRQCVIEGTGVDAGNFSTATEKDMLYATGLFEKPVSVTTGTVLYNGDILVTKTKGHTVIIVSGNPRTSSPVKPPLKINSNNKEIQRFLNKYYGAEIKRVIGALLDVDGIIGSKSKKALAIAFQVELNKFGAGLDVDGSVGSKTEKAFDIYVGTLKKGSKGIFVTLWQCVLVGKNLKLSGGIDGVYGNGTLNSTNELFAKLKLTKDGTVSGSDLNKIL